MAKATRYIELFDDIRNHVFQWATDEDWRKLPPKVNVAMKTLMNELKIAEALKSDGAQDADDDSITSEKRRFIALFKKKFLEYSGFSYNSPITPVNQCNIARLITDLKQEGGSYSEFLEWLFDDFLTVESNKSFWGDPPEINKICCAAMIRKYLFAMKDTLRIRRENIGQEAVRDMLLDIALPMKDRIGNTQFKDKLIDYDNKVISASKFFSLMQAFARKYNDTEALAKCERIAAQIEELKRRGG